MSLTVTEQRGVSFPKMFDTTGDKDTAGKVHGWMVTPKKVVITLLDKFNETSHPNSLLELNAYDDSGLVVRITVNNSQIPNLEGPWPIFAFVEHLAGTGRRSMVTTVLHDMYGALFKVAYKKYTQAKLV